MRSWPAVSGRACSAVERVSSAAVGSCHTKSGSSVTTSRRRPCGVSWLGSVAATPAIVSSSSASSLAFAAAPRSLGAPATGARRSSRLLRLDGRRASRVARIGRAPRRASARTTSSPASGSGGSRARSALVGGAARCEALRAPRAALARRAPAQIRVLSTTPLPVARSTPPARRRSAASRRPRQEDDEDVDADLLHQAVRDVYSACADRAAAGLQEGASASARRSRPARAHAHVPAASASMIAANRQRAAGAQRAQRRQHWAHQQHGAAATSATGASIFARPTPQPSATASAVAEAARRSSRRRARSP